MPNPDNKKIVHHKDGNPLNNRVENLEWVSQSDNVKHGYETRIILNGINHGSSKLTEQNVKDIREIWSKGKLSQAKIGKLFNIAQVTVHDIIHRKRWKHI